MIEFTPLINLADKLGIIQSLKDKLKNELINQPDPAAYKFITALDEISKLYSATESEIARYLSVDVDPSGIKQEDRELLNSLESGPLSLRWSKARGHCHKLMNIYDKYLNKWLSNFLDPDENEKMENLFSTFAIIEGGFLDNLDTVTDWLSKEATDTLDLIDKEMFGDAGKKVRSDRKDIHSFRQSMNRAMRQMLDLQSELIELTDTA